MKRLLNLACVSAVLCLAFAIPAPAQINNSVNFTTTFPFYAGNAKFPAGSYKVSAASFSGNTLQIENAGGTHSAFLEFTPTQAEAAHKTSDAGFKKYGTSEVLSTIWIAGQKFGMQLEVTKFEQSLAKAGAAAPHTVPAK